MPSSGMRRGIVRGPGPEFFDTVSRCCYAISRSGEGIDDSLPMSLPVASHRGDVLFVRSPLSVASLPACLTKTGFSRPVHRPRPPPCLS